FPASSWTSAMTTDAPSSAKRREVALPMPLAPPVTSATRPSNLAIVVSFVAIPSAAWRRSHAIGPGSSAFERLAEVVEQVVDRLDPYREPYVVVGCLALGAGDRGVGHLSGMHDEPLDRAERLREGEQLGGPAELHRGLDPTAETEAHHPAEPRHLARGDLVSRVVGKARPEHLGDRGVIGEHVGDRLGVLAVPLHAQVQGAAPA